MPFTFTRGRRSHQDDSLPSISALEGLRCLDVDKSGFVYALDTERVVKKYSGDDDEEARIERRAFDRLGHHPNIASLLAVLEDGSIMLERGQVLRGVLSQQDSANIPFSTKYRWIEGAANGLHYLHSHGIIHSDVGCRNMIVTRNGLKLIDFEGCSMDDELPCSSYEWFSYKPSTPRASVKTDIFVFGCTIYEIITNSPPYYEFKGMRNPREHVEQLYGNNQFQDVTDLPMGDLILDCWYRNFASMREVVERIRRFRRRRIQLWSCFT